MDRAFTRPEQRRVRWAGLVVALAASLGAAAMFASAALADSSGSATIWSGKNSCVAAAAGDNWGSVTFTRSDKNLTVQVAMNTPGAYGAKLFTLNGGSCYPGNGVFLGKTSSDGTATWNVKIKGSGHPVTVVLCVNEAGGFRFSDPVTLTP